METLEASYCNCGQLIIPPKERCIYCSEFTEPVLITNNGKLLTYTVLNITPEGIDKPLIIGLVELEVDLLSLINKKNLKSKPKLLCLKLSNNVDNDNLDIGMDVKIEIRDNIYYFK